MSGVMRTVVKVPGSGVVPVIGNGYVETAGRVAQREVEFFGVVAVGIGLAEACRPPCLRRNLYRQPTRRAEGLRRPNPVRATRSRLRGLRLPMLPLCLALLP